MSKPDLSVVIPVFNEEESIPLLIKKISSIKDFPRSHEIIFVNDGSGDKSEAIIEKLCGKNRKYKLISFTRNFGQQEAIGAGLKYSSGRHVGIMDADMQDPPKNLVKMYFLAKKTKVDIVYAIRRKREEGLIKKICYKLFYRLYSYASESPVNTDSGDFSIMSERVVKTIIELPENIKFIRGLRSWTGFKSLPYQIDRPKRLVGKPKYTLKKLYSLAINGFTSTSTRPLKIATIVGVLLSMFSVVLIIIYLVLWLVGNIHGQVPGFITIVVLILFFSGLQLFTLGILGEYIATIFMEVKGRPSFIIKKKTNLHK